MDNNTTFSINLGTYGSQHFSWCLVSSQLFTCTPDFWLVLTVLPFWVGSLLSTGSELMEGTGLELSSWLWRKHVRVVSAVFHNMLSWEMRLVPCTNEWLETSNAIRSWCRQWATTDFIRRHLPWPGSCQSWYVLTTNFTLQHQRDRNWSRERPIHRDRDRQTETNRDRQTERERERESA